MPKSLLYKSQILLSQQSLLLYPIRKSITPLQITNDETKVPIFHSPFSLSHNTHVQKQLTCAKRNKRQSGSQRLTRLILQSIPIIASKLKILPQPFDLIVGEFGGGVGGGVGFLKGFGGGGFDGWRRRVKKSIGFLMVCGLAFYLGRELQSNEFWYVLGVGLFIVVLVKGWKRGLEDMVLGLCWFGVLVGLGLKREEVQKMVKRFRVSSQDVRKRRRNGSTRAF
ncbi:hypothetical protein CFOL_v3_06700 [Cephalotus follicularis]|uniref:Transmembrane protein n=1 Tax=Cephalotus follicularis TaxID=3775 RepID=A0A1Q3B5D6_CEPFO|nr:hypothetical protein CFOL_v3_06700 [Cephalotus follicularis]